MIVLSASDQSGPVMPTVSERLISGTLALIDAEGGGNLSARRLAEASERSTMCIYTHFQGRAALLASAHRHAADELRATIDAATDALAGVRAFAERRSRLLVWLLTADETPMLSACCAELAEELLARLAEPGGRAVARDQLATAVGLAVLDPLLARP